MTDTILPGMVVVLTRSQRCRGKVYSPGSMFIVTRASHSSWGSFVSKGTRVFSGAAVKPLSANVYLEGDWELINDVLMQYNKEKGFEQDDSE